jgi:hypothetical protein
VCLAFESDLKCLMSQPVPTNLSSNAIAAATAMGLSVPNYFPHCFICQIYIIYVICTISCSVYVIHMYYICQIDSGVVLPFLSEIFLPPLVLMS